MFEKLFSVLSSLLLSYLTFPIHHALRLFFFHPLAPALQCYIVPLTTFFFNLSTLCHKNWRRNLSTFHFHSTQYFFIHFDIRAYSCLDRDTQGSAAVDEKDAFPNSETAKEIHSAVQVTRVVLVYYEICQHALDGLLALCTVARANTETGRSNHPKEV